MLVASVVLAFLASGSRAAPSGDRPLALRSPFSLWSALKFGGSFSECRLPVRLPRVFGRPGFYAVSLLAGLVSSASAVASAAQLAAAGRVTVPAGAVTSVLASLASAGVNFRVGLASGEVAHADPRGGVSTAFVLLVGIAGALVTVRITG